MKKILILVVAILIVGGGIFWFVSQEKGGEKIPQKTQPSEEPVVSEESIISEEPTPMIEDGGSYKCTYTMENGLETTTYVKNGEMRTEVNLPGDTNVSLYKDDKIYQWSEKEKQGVFMAVEEAKKQQGTEVQDPEEYLNNMKSKYKPDCKNMDLSDSLFALPKDVQFQDLSKMVK